MDLPDKLDVTVIAKQAMPLLADSSAAMDQALAQPVGCLALAEEAARAESACILICDFTRPVPNGVILPPLIRTLLDAGMAPERITVLVATGPAPAQRRRGAYCAGGRPLGAGDGERREPLRAARTPTTC